MEFVVSLPIKSAKSILALNAGAHQLPGSDCQGGASSRDEKLFKVSLKIASKLDGKDLEEFLKNKKDHLALPQDFIQALDVVFLACSLPHKAPENPTYLPIDYELVQIIFGFYNCPCSEKNPHFIFYMFFFIWLKFES